jgi:chromosome segregation ATPase
MEHMAAEKIPGWIERLLLPKLSEISGDVKTINGRIDALESNMNTRIDSLEAQIGSLRNETKTEIESLKNEINSKFQGLDYRFEAINTRLDSLDKRIPVIEELTALKIKIADIEKKMAMA